MAPFERLNLGQAASCQEQDPVRGNGILGVGCVRLCGNQCLSKALQFCRRQESLALTFWIPFDILARIGMLVPDPPGLG